MGWDLVGGAWLAQLRQEAKQQKARGRIGAQMIEARERARAEVPDVVRRPPVGAPPVSGAQWDEVRGCWQRWDDAHGWAVVGPPPPPWTVAVEVPRPPVVEAPLATPPIAHHAAPAAGGPPGAQWDELVGCWRRWDDATGTWIEVPPATPAF